MILQDERQVRQLIGRWAGAVREGDMDDILACHTDDVVMYAESPSPVRGDARP